MTKLNFLLKLKEHLSVLPKEDIEEHLNFYSEIIDDRIEDGLTEEEAVREAGAIDEIVTRIMEDVPVSAVIKQKLKPKRKLSVLEIILLILGSPIWLSLLIAVFAVLLSVYIVLWSIVISFWAIFVSVLVSGIGVILGGIVLICQSYSVAGVAGIGVGIICVGLSVLFFLVSKAITKGIILVTKSVGVGLKKLLISKGA